MPVKCLDIQQVSRACADHLEAMLNLLGAHAIRYAAADNEEIFEPNPGSTPLWEQLNILVTFPMQTDLTRVTQLLSDAFSLSPAQFTTHVLNDQDWHAKWQQQVKPQAYGEQLWIVPSCHQAPDPNATNVILDPGLAFGTGSHPTTRLCLQWLAAHGCRDANLIDYGCGSGILAIAALKLGAQHAWAIDINPQARLATQHNANTNDVLSRLSIAAPEECAPSKADILIANILLAPLIDLKTTFYKLLDNSGQLIVSGILSSQKDQLVQTYAPEFAVSEIAQDEDWLRICFAKC